MGKAIHKTMEAKTFEELDSKCNEFIAAHVVVPGSHCYTYINENGVPMHVHKIYYYE